MRRVAWLLVPVLAACAGPRPAAGPDGSTLGRDGAGIAETTHVRLHTTLPEGPRRRALSALLSASIESFTEMTHGSLVTIEVHFLETEAAWRAAVQERARARIGRELPLGRGLRRAAVTIDGTAFVFDIGGEDAHRLAAHEAWHAYAYHAFESRLPLWLDEAMACRAEGFYWSPGAERPLLRASANPTRRAQARALVAEGRLGTLGDHLRADPARLTHDRRALDDYYARAWLLGLTLEAPDLAPRLALGLARADRGTLASGGDGVEAVLGLTAVELEARWRHTALELSE